MKRQFSHFFLLIIPFLILGIAWGLDRVELSIRSGVGFSDPELSWWLLWLVRIVFTLVVVAGMFYLFRRKGIFRFYSILWLGLGLVAMFLATPLGAYLRSMLIPKFGIFFGPTQLFLLAGACLFMSGTLALITKSSN